MNTLEELTNWTSLRTLRARIVGIDEKVPLLDGRFVRYINLDNAATTPPLGDVRFG
jgi:hypothetical protein